MRRNILLPILWLVLIAAIFLMPTDASAAAELTEGYYFYAVFNGQATITYCSAFTSGEIIIPSTLGGYPVTIIGSDAFRDCGNLTNITIPDSVISIGDSAFSGCSRLTSITIPDNVISIGDSAFEGCSCLTSITIPDSVTSIGTYAFWNCNNLNRVNITDIAAWCSIDFVEHSSNPLCNGGNLYLYGEAITDWVIPDCVTNIKDYAFSYCGLTSVIIPDSVVSIGESAFYGCYNLTSISIGDGVLSIEPLAFFDCDLKSVTIGDNVNSIGDYAFSECTSMTSITIPHSVTSIGDGAFMGCISLKDVYYTGTQEMFNSIFIGNDNHQLLYFANLTVNYRPAHFCEYSDCVVTVKPTFTTEGEHSKTCTICGETVTETLEMLVGKVAQWNIALQNDFGVNFYLDISQSIEDTAKVRLTIANDTVTYNVSDLEKSEDGHFQLTVNVSAAQMNDLITVMVMDGGDVGSTDNYSVRQYCDTILADASYSQYHALVKEMLNYGAMAQIYFGYDTENLANDGITDVANENVPETVEEVAVSDSIDNLNFYGASLVYRDRIAVRFYFTGDVTGLGFTANSKTYTPVAKDGMYYIEIADILPQNLEQQILLTATDAQGNILKVSYGPMNYIVRMNQKDNENMKNLLKALYNYHVAAKELFGKDSGISGAGDIEFDTITPGKLIMSTNAFFRPYEFYEGDKIVGIDIEIAEAIAQKLGLELIIRDMEFKSIITAVATGTADFCMAGITSTTDRLREVDFSISYTNNVQVFIIKEGSAIKSISDLYIEGANYRIGVQHGTTGDIYASDEFFERVSKYTNIEQAIWALKNGNVDCVIIDDRIAKSIVNANEGLYIMDFYSSEEYAACFAQENDALREAFNEIIEELIMDGTIDAIIEKYIPNITFNFAE